MGTAIYVVAKKKVKGLDAFVNGKAVGRIDDALLEKLCTDAGVESLMSFVSQDPDELSEFLEDEGMESEGEEGFPAEEWFTPEQGLVAVRGLSAYLGANPDIIPDCAAVVEDLNEYEAVLSILAEKKIHWHFAVDF